MAAITSTRPVPVEEYIARFVEGGEKPMYEYVDGVLLPKSMGTKKHSQVQANITKLIGSRYDDTLNALPELTARLRDTQFYVPDVAVEDLAKPIRAGIPTRTIRFCCALRSCRLPIALESFLASAKNIAGGVFPIVE